MPRAKTSWKAAKKRANLPDITLYSWRHTLGRYFRAHKVPTDQIKVQLGHRVLGVTERYAEFDPQYLSEASAAIQAFWKLCEPKARQQKTDDYAKSLEIWCRLRGLNSRPSVYKTAALGH
jgi:hypothetical protein